MSVGGGKVKEHVGQGLHSAPIALYNVPRDALVFGREPPPGTVHASPARDLETWEDYHMKLTRRSVVLGALTLPLMSSVAFAADKILASVPGLSFPFFVHMMNAFKAEIEKQGYEAIESDGQVSSPKQTADIEAAITQGVKGIVISPNEVDAMAPALQQAVEASIPVVTVDRRVPSVEGILAHVGADNVKGGEAQGNLIVSMFPDGATIINLQGQSGASPAIDRNKGLHNVLDADGRQVQDRLRADRRLRPRQGPVGDGSRTLGPRRAAEGDRCRQ